MINTTNPASIVEHSRALAKDKVSATDNDTVYNDLGLAHKKSETKKNDASEIGDFMTLFLAQLRNQDPLDPQEGAEFVAQLAQFNTVESLHKIDDSVKNMSDTFKSSRILEATGMIGKSVHVTTNKMTLNSEIRVDENGNKYLEASPVAGEMRLPNINENQREGDKARIIDNVRVIIKNAVTGEIVQENNLGAAIPGKVVPLFWDATYKNTETGKYERIKDQNGNVVPDGQYLIDVEAYVGEVRHKVPTTIATPVDSISIDGGHITLNAANIGSVSLSDLKQVTENTKKQMTREEFQNAMDNITENANKLMSQQSSATRNTRTVANQQQRTSQ